MATLDRLREIVRNHRPSAVPAVDVGGGGSLNPPAGIDAPAPMVVEALDHTRAALTLGGALIERSEGSVIVVDREYRADALHGHTPIGEIVSTINEGADALRLMSKAWPSAAGIVGAGGSEDQHPRSRLMFLDLETTGLFGGAGTQAFLIGCASIEGDAIRVRQFLMPGFEHERAVLNEFDSWAKSQDSLCTYNGRSFDVPLIETRFMYHRAPCPVDGRPHLDMLHAARRLWRQRPVGVGPDPDDSSCSLGVLEKHIAGLHRIGDVPG